jgi:hypothetical protein
MQGLAVGHLDRRLVLLGRVLAGAGGSADSHGRGPSAGAWACAEWYY